jgi:hypothetical protein
MSSLWHRPYYTHLRELDLRQTLSARNTATKPHTTVKVAQEARLPNFAVTTDPVRYRR